MVAVNGGTATFTVTATSGTTLSYQWYKDGLLILDQKLTGETRSTLVLTNLSSADEGKYFVKVSNAGGTVTSTKASLTVITNSPPVANRDIYTTSEEIPLIIPASGVLTNDTDVNGQTLAATLVSTVTHGALTFNADGSFTYIPVTNYYGLDSFTYRVSDGYPAEQNNLGVKEKRLNSGETGAQSFSHGTAGTYMISKVVVYLSRQAGASGGPLNFSIGTNVNSGSITSSVVAIPWSAITNSSDGYSFQPYEIVYSTPIGPFIAGATYYLNFDNQSGRRMNVQYSDANSYSGGTYYDKGSDQNKDMRFQIYETATSNPATVTLNVTPVNDAPIAVDDAYTMLEDDTLAVPTIAALATNTPSAAITGVLANDYDTEGNALSAVLVSNVTHGKLSLNPDGSFSYKPNADYNGTDSFTYRASDGSTMGNVATVSIKITPVSDPVRIQSGEMTSNGFQLHLTGLPDNGTYVILASTDLQNWTPISTNVAVTANAVFTDAKAANHSKRYYRAVVR